MSRRMPPYSLRDFSLGLNDKDDPYMIDEKQLAEVENAILKKGVIEERYGYKKYTPVGIGPIHKLYDFYKTSGREFLAVSAQQLHKANGLTAVPGLLSSNTVQMLTYKNRSLADVVLLADGGKLKVYNGTNVSEVTAHSPTTAEQTDPGMNDLANYSAFRYVAMKKDRIFAAAHPTVKNRVSFCHRDPVLGYAVYDYWPATHFFDVGGNDEITQLKTFRDALITFCKRSVWVLYGDGRTLENYELHKVNVPGGCIAPDSVQEVGNFLFYLSDDHVYSLFSTEQNYVSAEPISVNIENTLKSISRADKEKATSVFFDNKYFLSFPGGITVIFDVITKSWTKWTGIQANSFLERDGVLYFSHDQGYIYQFDESIYNDDGKMIPFKMATKNTDFGFDVNPKDLQRMWVNVKQYLGQPISFDLKMTIDYNTYTIASAENNTPLVWGEGNWGETVWGFSDVVQVEIDFRDIPEVQSQGKTMQFIIENKKLNQPLTIYGLTFEYKWKKAR